MQAQNRQQTLYNSSTSHNSIQQSSIKISFSANEKQIIVLWLMGILPSEKISINIVRKQIKGSKNLAQALKTQIQKFCELNRMIKISSELTNNQRLYIVKKFAANIFDKNQIIKILDKIKKYVGINKNASAYQIIRKQFSKLSNIFIIVVLKQSTDNVKKQIDIMFKHAIDPTRQMIKNKKIPNIISLQLEKLSSQKTNQHVGDNDQSSSESQKQVISSSDDQQITPNFYTQTYQTQIIPKTKKYEQQTSSSCEKQCVVYKQKRYKFNKQQTKTVYYQNQKIQQEKTILYYKQIQSKYFILDKFKTWIRSNKIFSIRDFYFQKNYQKKIDIIKLTNQFGENKHVQHLSQYFNHQEICDLSVLHKSEIQLIAKRVCKGDKQAYRCKLLCNKKNNQKKILLKISGLQPIVVKIHKNLEQIVQIFENTPIDKVYKVSIGKLQSYAHLKPIKNLIINQIMLKIEQQQYNHISFIYKFVLCEGIMKVKVKRTDKKIRKKQDHQLQTFLSRKKLIHETQLTCDQVPSHLINKFPLYPSAQNNGLLVMICLEKQSRQYMNQIMKQMMDNTFIHQKIQIQDKFNPFLDDIISQTNQKHNKNTDIKLIKNQICITGSKKAAYNAKQQLLNKIESEKDKLKSRRINIGLAQCKFLYENKQQYRNQVMQKFKVSLIFVQNQSNCYQLELMYQQQKNMEQTLKYLKELLSSHKIQKVLNYKLSPQAKVELIKIQGIQIVQQEDQFKITSFSKISINSALQMLNILNAPKPKQNIPQYPANWSEQTSDVQLFNVKQYSPEYQQIQNNFKAGKIVNLKRIQNKPAYSHYIKQLKYLTQINGSTPQTQYLYHGTSKTPPEFIYQDKQQTFNVNYTGDRNLLGRGVYFAVKSEYSINYSYTLPNGNKVMLYCEVITGDAQNVIHKDREMKDTQYKDINKQIRYQSATCFTGNSIIYAIYKSRRAYPHYVIEYTTDKGRIML